MRGRGRDITIEPRPNVSPRLTIPTLRARSSASSRCDHLSFCFYLFICLLCLPAPVNCCDSKRKKRKKRLGQRAWAMRHHRLWPKRGRVRREDGVCLVSDRASLRPATASSSPMMIDGHFGVPTSGRGVWPRRSSPRCRLDSAEPLRRPAGPHTPEAVTRNFHRRRRHGL